MPPYKGTVIVDGQPIEWETTFDDSVKFQCTKCGFCCVSQHVDVLDEDITRLAKATKQSVADFCEAGDTQRFRLKQDEKKGCVFLSGSLCSVHTERPGMCRQFPFKVIPYSATKVFIDVSQSCNSIINRKFSEQNQVDFGEIVRRDVLMRKTLPQHPDFHALEFSLAGRIDDQAISSVIWKDIIDTLGTCDLLGVYQLMEIAQLLREKYQHFDPVNVTRYLEEAIAVFHQSEKKITSHFYVRAAQQLLEEKQRAGTLRLVSMGDSAGIYFIDLDNTGVTFVAKTGGVVTRLAIDDIRDHRLDPLAVNFLRSYLQSLWDRKHLTQQFFIALAKSPPLSMIPSSAIQLEVGKKLCSALHFFVNVSATKNRHEAVTVADVKEAVLMLDRNLAVIVREHVQRMIAKISSFVR